MNKVKRIIFDDTRRICRNVVAVIVIIGLCIVPCLYAWFNIFSNWSPYGEDATSRIKVAVVSQDKGVSVLGLDINVGGQVIEALKANSSIGWQFVDSADEALEGVYSGNYYAALVVPGDFSQDVVSFLGGDLTNPQLMYYENDKKNAIAPKITGKAQTAVREQVNATFVSTLASDLTKIVSVADANGIDATDLLTSIADKASDLQDKLGGCVVMINAAASMSDSAQSLLGVSRRLLGDTAAAAGSGSAMLDQASGDLDSASGTVDSTTAAVSSALTAMQADLDSIYSSIESEFSDMNRYNDFVATGLESDKALVQSMKNTASEIAASLNSLGLTGMANKMSALAARYGELYDMLSALETANDETWAPIREKQQAVLDKIDECREAVSGLRSDVEDTLRPQLEQALSSVQNATDSAKRLLEKLGGSASNISSLFDNYINSIGSLKNGLRQTASALSSLQSELGLAAQLMESLADSELVQQLGDTLSENGDLIGSYIASPIKMDTEVVYGISEYGSAMAPFYTVLAQWVGALLCAVLLKVKIKSDEYGRLNVFQRFFGRYALFFFVAMAQALIVAVGDLWYVQIQCISPWRFILASCVCGLSFSMINYALVFALDNIGMAISVIVMVIQVAGSGGTYPVEVLPGIFGKCYDYMPFKYAMNAMRETVGGMYGTDYRSNILVLLLFALGAVVLGLALYYPARPLNGLIDKSKKKSEIML